MKQIGLTVGPEADLKEMGPSATIFEGTSLQDFRARPGGGPGSGGRRHEGNASNADAI
jgi:hypothetical protein